MEQHKMAIEELARGQERANKLQELIIAQSCKTEVEADGGSESCKDLTEGVLKSFTNTLSILKNIGHVDEVSQVSADGSRSEESDEGSKFSNLNIQKGRYKRRKNTYTRYVESPNWNIDGHAWRKYGQKDIFKSKYPRNYFRCTHKNEQGCQATKQVQRIQEDPPLYRTTYFGQHICRNLLNDPELVFDDLFAEEGNSKLLSFSNNNAKTPFSLTKRECSVEPPTPSDVTEKPSSLPVYYVPSDVPNFDNSAENLSQTSVHSVIDNVMMVGPADFDDLCILQEYYCS